MHVCKTWICWDFSVAVTDFSPFSYVSMKADLNKGLWGRRTVYNRSCSEHLGIVVGADAIRIDCIKLSLDGLSSLEGFQRCFHKALGKDCMASTKAGIRHVARLAKSFVTRCGSLEAPLSKRLESVSLVLVMYGA